MAPPESNVALDENQVADVPEYKMGEKLSIAKYQELDADDDAMVRWKKSLGLGVGNDISDPNDPRLVIIKSLAFLPEGRDEVVFDLTTPEALESLKKNPFTIKEGATFRLRVVFQVQHQILSGLKYRQTTTRAKVFSTDIIQMIGSYPPNTDDKPEHAMTFEPETVPSGMMARGKYTVSSRFVDDDKKEYLKFDWVFEIKKDWD